MSRLRHPIRAIREPFGKAGLTVAVIALVFAMVGGAFAAAGLNGKQKKEVKKIAKKFAGKRGPAGAQGAPGAPGANGTNGSDGANGTNGAPGKDGNSVIATEILEGEEACNELGGAEFEVQGSGVQTFACNGAEGAEGAEGPPGPITGELPAGVTLTGVWATNFASSMVGVESVALSYGLHLSSAPTVNYFNEAGTALKGSASNCPGSPGEPKANPGNLCVYVSFESEEEKPSVQSTESPAPKSGGLITLGLPPGAFARGSWAVTAPTAP